MLIRAVRNHQQILFSTKPRFLFIVSSWVTQWQMKFGNSLTLSLIFIEICIRNTSSMLAYFQKLHTSVQSELRPHNHN